MKLTITLNGLDRPVLYRFVEQAGWPIERVSFRSAYTFWLSRHCFDSRDGKA
jgi:hypothetical protein